MPGLRSLGLLRATLYAWATDWAGVGHPARSDASPREDVDGTHRTYFSPPRGSALSVARSASLNANISASSDSVWRRAAGIITGRHRSEFCRNPKHPQHWAWAGARSGYSAARPSIFLVRDPPPWPGAVLRHWRRLPPAPCATAPPKVNTADATAGDLAGPLLMVSDRVSQRFQARSAASETLEASVA